MCVNRMGGFLPNKHARSTALTVVKKNVFSSRISATFVHEVRAFVFRGLSAAALQSLTARFLLLKYSVLVTTDKATTYPRYASRSLARTRTAVGDQDGHENKQASAKTCCASPLCASRFAWSAQRNALPTDATPRRTGDAQNIVSHLYIYCQVTMSNARKQLHTESFFCSDNY